MKRGFGGNFPFPKTCCIFLGIFFTLILLRFCICCVCCDNDKNETDDLPKSPPQYPQPIWLFTPYKINTKPLRSEHNSISNTLMEI